jgi:NTE family protein
MAGKSSNQREEIVLVLQGGGALGAYQAGAYEALSKHGLAPDWIAGISIGAINGAIIAGNEPENRVKRPPLLGARVVRPAGHSVHGRWPSSHRLQ